MSNPRDEREREMTRLREEIIRTTREVYRLARGGEQPEKTKCRPTPPGQARRTRKN